jgi:hypothetical protein
MAAWLNLSRVTKAKLKFYTEFSINKLAVFCQLIFNDGQNLSSECGYLAERRSAL